MQAIAYGSGFFPFAVEGKATLFHHSDRAGNRRKSVGDDAGYPLVAAKEVDDSFCGFGGEAAAFERRKNRITKLGLRLEQRPL